ncbi:MAG: class I SAM-dependent methyltransferase [Sandaracinaceae bacterium]|nr:class I SAM-dependent methyltransferase [Sandaracinaceae bacterium]
MTSSQEHSDEIERIMREYERRTNELDPGFYSLSKAANLFTRQSQVRAIAGALRRAGKMPLSSYDVLDVGCGRGDWLTEFELLGAARARLHGIELVPDFARVAQARLPGTHIVNGDAASLPWKNHAFDVVFQSTVFTSILDASVKNQIAAEMRRVLRPGGIVLWYDFTYDNPKNKSVKGVGRGEIKKLFPGATFHFERTTLAPPIARRLVDRSWTLAFLLENVRALNTHCLATIQY